jgi:hypothetical protein
VAIPLAVTSSISDTRISPSLPSTSALPPASTATAAASSGIGHGALRRVMCPDEARRRRHPQERAGFPAVAPGAAVPRRLASALRSRAGEGDDDGAAIDDGDERAAGSAVAVGRRWATRNGLGPTRQTGSRPRVRLPGETARGHLLR